MDSRLRENDGLSGGMTVEWGNDGLGGWDLAMGKDFAQALPFSLASLTPSRCQL